MTAATSTLLVFFLIAASLSGCGEDASTTTEKVDCGSSALTWETAGAPYVNNYCRGCHSRDLSSNMRAGAPIDVNFDSKEDLIRASSSVIERIEDRSMPPVGSPDSRSESAFLEWIGCQTEP